MILETRKASLRALSAALATTLCLAIGSRQAHASGTSTLTGRASITSDPVGFAAANTPASIPVATMTLTFNGDRNDVNHTVDGILLPFTVVGTAAIVGTTIFNSWYMDTCVDTQSITSSEILAGMFDRASGRLDDLRLAITVHHVLSPGPMTSFWGTVGGCANTTFPDDVVLVSLTTNGGGAPVDQAGPGQITLVGTGTGSSGRFTGTPVFVTITGVLSPPPDRSLPEPGCVVVPDVTDGVPNNAANYLRSLGLQPAFQSRPGPPPRNPYIYRQDPDPDTCVPPGSTVVLYIQSGPVQ